MFCYVPAFCRDVWLLRSRFWSLKWLGCFVMFLIALFFVCFDCFKSSGSPLSFVESRTALHFFCGIKGSPQVSAALTSGCSRSQPQHGRTANGRVEKKETNIKIGIRLDVREID